MRDNNTCWKYISKGMKIQMMIQGMGDIRVLIK